MIKSNVVDASSLSIQFLYFQTCFIIARFLVCLQIWFAQNSEIKNLVEATIGKYNQELSIHTRKLFQ